MTCPSTSSVGLIFLLIGYVAAAVHSSAAALLPASPPPTDGPEPDVWPRAVRSSACQEHTSLHNRLDVVEKQKVEDTVEKLEVELAALLDAIEAPEWRPLLDDKGKTTVDILEDPGQRS